MLDLASALGNSAFKSCLVDAEMFRTHRKTPAHDRTPCLSRADPVVRSGARIAATRPRQQAEPLLAAFEDNRITPPSTFSRGVALAWPSWQLAQHLPAEKACAAGAAPIAKTHLGHREPRLSALVASPIMMRRRKGATGALQQSSEAAVETLIGGAARPRTMV